MVKQDKIIRFHSSGLSIIKNKFNGICPGCQGLILSHSAGETDKQTGQLLAKNCADSKE